MQIRPMLAAKFEEARVALHLAEDGFLLMQPKIDGMRVMFHNQEARSRSWSLWTNAPLQKFAKDSVAYSAGWDGELLPGLHDIDNPDPEVFRRAMSEVRSQEGNPEMTYFLFDNFHFTENNYQWRQEKITRDVQNLAPNQKSYDISRTTAGNVDYHVRVHLCPTKPVYSMDEIYETYTQFLADGWEGAILRRWRTGYKYGRATPKQGALTKMKPVADAEAIVVGYEPRYHNANGQTINNLGLTSRSAHQANMVAEDCLGALRCKTSAGAEFSIGVFKGLSHSDKERLWADRDSLPGRIVKFEHAGYGGGYDVPRTPVFVSFRSPEDL